MCRAVADCDVDPTWRICKKHATRLARTGTLDAQPWHRRTACLVDECETLGTNKGLCSTHAARLRRHGDVTVTLRRGMKVGQARKVVVSYEGAHDRVRALRGPARLHACVGCQAPAHEWSYDGNDPDEIRGGDGLYSLSVEHYLARCRSCHKRLDRAMAAFRIAA